MICLFSNKATKEQLLNTNGEYVIDNICIDYEIEEELNGNFTFNGTFVIDKNIPKKVYDMLNEDFLIKADDETTEEIFRIASIRKNKKTIEVFARHISISELLNMWCEDVRPTDLNGNSAINWIFDKCTTNNWFTVSSNISRVNTAYYMNKNVYQALFDSDNSFIKRWGGEIKRTGFTMAINDKIGSNRGVSIRSRKNLLGLEVSTNNEITTRVYPKGYNGITITEKFIDSTLINNYSRPYTKEVKFDDIRVNDEDYQEGFATLELAQAELKKRVKKLYEEDKIDIVSASYRVDFIELSKTEEYKNYSILEHTFLGDTVNVFDEDLNINIDVRVTKRKYNGKKKRRVETELSNKDTKNEVPSIKDVLEQLEKLPEDLTNTLQQAKDHATNLINNGLKDSYVVVRKNEILIMNSKDINTATKVWRWNRSGLGYSSTGYYGEYGTAITNDGRIVADFITTGILNADLIRTGNIRNKLNTFEMNLENGTGVEFKNNGHKAIEIKNNNINFYDWQGTERKNPVGQMYSARNNSEATKTGLAIANKINSYFTIAYEKDNNFYAYISFDNNNILGLSESSILFHRWIDIGGNSLNFENGLHKLFSSTTKNFILNFSNDFYITKSDASRNILYYLTQYNSFYMDSKLYVYEDMRTDKNLTVSGNLSVYGNKNCIQKTKNYGTRAFYSLEDCGSYLTDRTMEIQSVDSVSKEKKITLDPIFLECVNTNIPYTIEIIKQGWGDYKIKEQTTNYFIVESDRNDFTFKYVITAKRKGFENERNKEIIVEENLNSNLRNPNPIEPQKEKPFKIN